MDLSEIIPGMDYLKEGNTQIWPKSKWDISFLASNQGKIIRIQYT